MTKSQQETIHACRFCFMCRHLSPTGNVTFREADTPRGRALILGRAGTQPDLWRNSDYVEAFYRTDLSGACRQHCVSHYDEVGLVLAARRELVQAGLAPAAVRELATQMAAEPVRSSGARRSALVYYVDAYTAAHVPETAAALTQVFTAIGLQATVITASDSGRGLHVLGYLDEARQRSASIAEAIAASGATLVVASCPASYHAFRRDYAEFGTPLPSGIEVLHSSEFLQRLVAERRLPFATERPTTVFSLASDYLRNYMETTPDTSWLTEVGINTAPFGTNHEESHSAGEGAVVLDRLYPALVTKLVAYTAERVSRSSDILLTYSPYTRYVLGKLSARHLQVTTCEELVAARLTADRCRSAASSEGAAITTAR